MHLNVVISTDSAKLIEYDIFNEIYLYLVIVNSFLVRGLSNTVLKYILKCVYTYMNLSSSMLSVNRERRQKDRNATYPTRF